MAPAANQDKKTFVRVVLSTSVKLNKSKITGTCSFYGYATLYVIKKGKRVTLAIKAIRCQDTKVAIITYLLALIEPLNFKIKHLYLDREFFCVPVIRWLQALNIPFIMPVITYYGNILV